MITLGHCTTAKETSDSAKEFEAFRWLNDVASSFFVTYTVNSTIRYSICCSYCCWTWPSTAVTSSSGLGPRGAGVYDPTLFGFSRMSEPAVRQTRRTLCKEHDAMLH